MRASGVVVPLIVALLASAPAMATPAVVEAEFQRLHPCPANDAKEGECPGYAILHVVPLCLGGPDVAYNLRWQKLSERKPGDVVEARECSASRPRSDSPATPAPLNRT